MSRLRVHGIERLRVVDGSIMPIVVSGKHHTCMLMTEPTEFEIARTEL